MSGQTGRTVYIKVDGNGQPLVIENFEGTTRKELENAIAEAGHSVSFENARVVLKSTRTDLVDDNAQIPIDLNEVFIFVVPLQMKGGASYAEMKEEIKTIIARDGEPAQQHFGRYHMNNATALRSLLDSYEGAEETTTEATVATTEEGQELVAAVAELRSAKETLDIAHITVNEKIDNVLAIIIPEGGEVPTVFGGATLEELNEDFNSIRSTTKRAK